MLCKSLLLFFLIASCCVLVHAQTTARQYEKKAIICLTYDDGLESQLSIAIPQLDAAGLKGIFFLNSIHGSSTSEPRASEAVIGWTGAAKNGHELASHTLFYPCPEKLGWPNMAGLVATETVLLRITKKSTL